MTAAHPEDQGLACPGCRKTFQSGKSYQAHIISNKCKSSAVVALNKHNGRRNRMKKALREAAEAVPNSNSSQNDFQPRLETNDNEVIAVSTSFYSTREKPESLERACSPWSQNSPNDADASLSAASTAVSDVRYVPYTEDSGASESPVFGSQPCGLPFSLYCLPISPDDLIAYEDDLDDGVWQSSSIISEPSDEDQNSRPLAKSGYNYIRDILPNWDSEKYWNSESKRYFCSCGFTNPFVKVFEQHVVMERTQDRRYCAHCGNRFNTIVSLYRHIESVHVNAVSFAPKKGGNERAVKPSNLAERRLDLDGPMDIGEKEFQIYDRPPVFNENNQRSRSKNDFGLRSTKVPHGTYW
ncbi:hypothetical protein VI817_006915 [Penicillium citrinum]|nr:hypothetical protein VI817_006915 [Penicillium citrinum]